MREDAASSAKSSDDSKESSQESPKVFTFAAQSIVKSIKKNSPRLSTGTVFSRSTPRKGSLVKSLLGECDDEPDNTDAATPLPNG